MRTVLFRWRVRRWWWWWEIGWAGTYLWGLLRQPVTWVGDTSLEWFGLDGLGVLLQRSWSGILSWVLDIRWSTFVVFAQRGKGCCAWLSFGWRLRFYNSGSRSLFHLLCNFLQKHLVVDLIQFRYQHSFDSVYLLAAARYQNQQIEGAYFDLCFGIIHHRADRLHQLLHGVLRVIILIQSGDNP